METIICSLNGYFQYSFIALRIGIGMVCIHNHSSKSQEQSNCFIIHPIVLKEIAKNGNENQKKDAERALESIISIRGRRLSLLRQPRPTLTKLLQPHLNRLVYNSKHSGSLPGELKRREEQGSIGDSDVDKAYDYAGDAFKLFKEALGRTSIDNNGMPLVSSVHYVEPLEEYYNNASWNGEQMIYGDTDPSIFKTVLMRTVAAHEMGHGVVQYEGGLAYQKDTGALNEHFADVFGILTDQLIKGQDVNQSNWLIAEGIWADNIRGIALRSMIKPGTAYDDPLIGRDRQPGHMEEYVNLPIDPLNDWGGVHINSGIPNSAFCKASRNVGGNAWESTGLIWYAALRILPGKPNHSSFQDLANTTTEVAQRLFEDEPKKHEAVRNAWREVGIEPKLLMGREFINSLIAPDK